MSGLRPSSPASRRPRPAHGDARRMRGRPRLRAPRAAGCGPLHARGAAGRHGRRGRPGPAASRPSCPLAADWWRLFRLGAARRHGPAGARQQSDPPGGRGQPAPEPGQPARRLRRVLPAASARSSTPAGSAPRRVAAGPADARLDLQPGDPERHRQLRARRVRRRAPDGRGAAGPGRLPALRRHGGLPDPVRQRRQHQHRARRLCGRDPRDRAADRPGEAAAPAHRGAGPRRHRALFGRARHPQPDRRQPGPLAPLRQKVSQTEDLLATLEGVVPSKADPARDRSGRARAAGRPAGEPALRPGAPAPRHPVGRGAAACGQRQHRRRDRRDVPELQPERHLRRRGLATSASFSAASGRFWSIGPSATIPVFQGGTPLVRQQGGHRRLSSSRRQPIARPCSTRSRRSPTR